MSETRQERRERRKQEREERRKLEQTGGIRDPLLNIKGSTRGNVISLLGDIVGTITSSVDTAVKSVDLIISTIKLPNDIGNAYDNTNAPGSNNNPGINPLQQEENFTCQHNLNYHLKKNISYDDYKSI